MTRLNDMSLSIPLKRVVGILMKTTTQYMVKGILDVQMCPFGDQIR